MKWVIRALALCAGMGMCACQFDVPIGNNPGGGGNAGTTSNLQGGGGSASGSGGNMGCTSDAACSATPEAPHCDTASGACVACVTNDHCLGNTQNPVCAASTHTCVHCVTNEDCALDPNGPICEAEKNRCVACLPAADPLVDCGAGTYCNAETGQCMVGCTGDADCLGLDPYLQCDLDKLVCVGCLADPDCPAGSICVDKTCVPGCNETHACQPGASCCGMSCYDLSVDEENCGTCGLSCVKPPNAQVLCSDGQCVPGACEGFYKNCNGDWADGCETNILVEGVDGECVCTPGAVQSCYSGATGTQNVGVCKGGTQTCKPDGLGWTPCVGAVYPSSETCNGMDDDCNGQIDEDSDLDGWSVCDDCNDANATINVGAFEVTDDGIDNDCDPTTSDAVGLTCPTVTLPKLSGVTALDMAQAMELCQGTTLNPPMSQKKWGLIASDFKLANGTDPSSAVLTTFQTYQAAIQKQYGYVGGNPAVPNNAPQKGPSMASFSTGRMRYTGQPGYLAPQTGTDMGGLAVCPDAYKAAHGGQLPSSSGPCGTCTTSAVCEDSIALRLQIRVPTNAKGFSYDFKFYSAEYSEYVCTQYNDFYLALLTGGAPGIPADKNITFDSLGNPVSVNNGLFEVCPPALCPNGTPMSCPAGVAELAGTGLDTTGGGTLWLTTQAPVVPGEVISIDFMLFDVGDQIYDSLVLLDNFRWKLNPTIVVTDHEQCNDGIDNDDDGLVDCMDPSCVGKPGC